MNVSANFPESFEVAGAAEVQFYRTVLHELIEMGVELARDVCGQAKAAGLPLAEATVMYERVCLAVRRTIALAQRVGEPVAVRAPGAEATRRAARRQILRTVEDVIVRQEPAAEQRECLRSELYERMDRPELQEELDMRPADEIIADICRDLGIVAMSGARCWPRRTPADVIALCARAARPRAAAAWDAAGGSQDGGGLTPSIARVLQRVARDSGSG